MLQELIPESPAGWELLSTESQKDQGAWTGHTGIWGGQEGLDGDGGNLMVSASSGPVGFFPLQGFGFLLL